MVAAIATDPTYDVVAEVIALKAQIAAATAAGNTAQAALLSAELLARVATAYHYAPKAARGGYANVLDFGATPDPTVDSSVAIQNAINSVSASGGGTVLLPGRFGTSVTITIPTKVKLLGYGGGNTISGNTPDPTTAASALIALSSMTSVIDVIASGQYASIGVAINDIFIDCADLASYGIRWKSVSHSECRGCTIVRPTVEGLLITTLPTGTLSVGPQDSQSNLITNLTVVCVSAAAAAAHGIALDSDPGFGSDASENVLMNIYVRHTNGNGIDFRNCDGNRVYFLRTAPKNGSATGYGAYFHEDAAGGGHNARGNCIFGAELAASSGSGGGAYFAGNTTDTVSYYSNGNSIFGYSRNNGAPDPTFEKFAKGIVYDEYGVKYTSLHPLTGTGTSVATAQQTVWLADTSSADVTLNSFANGKNGQIVTIIHNGGAHNLILKHGATGTQPLSLRSGADATLASGSRQFVCYNNVWYEL